jgi:molybdopterin converting factor small subunit
MAVTVRIPGALRAEAGGASAVECSTGDGATLASVLDDMAATWPLLERRIRDERGELRRYVNVYVDGEECRRLEGLGTPVTDRTEILVIPSVAGG